MKSFKDFISEDGEGGGMVSAVGANSIAAGGIAGVTDNNPPVGRNRKKRTLLTPSPLKRSAPVKM